MGWENSRSGIAPTNAAKNTALCPACRHCSFPQQLCTYLLSFYTYLFKNYITGRCRKITEAVQRLRYYRICYRLCTIKRAARELHFYRSCTFTDFRSKTKLIQSNLGNVTTGSPGFAVSKPGYKADYRQKKAGMKLRNSHIHFLVSLNDE